MNDYNKDNDAKYDDYGISYPLVLKPFDDAFHKSGFSAFQKFLLQNNHIKKWILASDYVLYDKNKPNNVVVFSIIPHRPFLSEKFISSNLPKDFKKTKDFSKNSLDFLRKMNVFSICLIFPKTKENFFTTNSALKGIVMWKTIFSRLIKMLDLWCKDNNNPNVEYLKSTRERVKKLSKILCQGNFGLWQDIFIISCFVAYLVVEMSLIINIELIGWFSDRDKILSFNSKIIKEKNKSNHPFIHDLVVIYQHVLAVNKNSPQPKLCFGIPNDDKNEMWYDFLNRIPDIVAGCIADYNFDDNAVSSAKTCSLLEDVVSDNENIQIFNLHSLSQVWRYDINKS